VAWSILVELTHPILQASLSYYLNGTFPGNRVVYAGLDTGAISMTPFSSKVPQEVVTFIQQRAQEMTNKLLNGSSTYHLKF